jgi:predicted dehydrogenase
MDNKQSVDNKKKSTRREFIATTGIGAAGIAFGMNSLSAKNYSRSIGSNDKIRVGFIGVGNRGSQLLHTFMTMSDCEVAALCDVYEPYISRDYSKVDPRYISTRPGQIPKMGETFPGNVEKYTDYRKLLENKSIDAVVIATPDHWHALQTIHSVQAGKDVYVEKPVSKTIEEGRAMVRAAKESKQVVTVGLNRRGASTFQKLAKDIPGGKIGKVCFASACHVGNMYPAGIGKLKPENPPAGFDWDSWIGPRAYRPYQYNIAPYMFRWWEDYANQISNNGIHYLDLIRWMLNEEAPIWITAGGGKYAVDDDRTIPDTMQATYEFASGSLVSINIIETSSGSFIPYGFIEMRGTKGNLLTAENNYKIIPAQPGQFQTWNKLMEPETVNFETSDPELLSDGKFRDSTANMIRNFLDCIKSRQESFCTLEEGHRSTSLAHLATIAMLTNEKLRWDAKAEKFINSDRANQMLGYEYRESYRL